jgi:hypothetical protein
VSSLCLMSESEQYHKPMELGGGGMVAASNWRPPTGVSSAPAEPAPLGSTASSLGFLFAVGMAVCPNNNKNNKNNSLVTPRSRAFKALCRRPAVWSRRELRATFCDVLSWQSCRSKPSRFRVPIHCFGRGLWNCRSLFLGGGGKLLVAMELPVLPHVWLLMTPLLPRHLLVLPALACHHSGIRARTPGLRRSQVPA